MLSVPESPSLDATCGFSEGLPERGQTPLVSSGLRGTVCLGKNPSGSSSASTVVVVVVVVVAVAVAVVVVVVVLVLAVVD